MQKTEKTYCQGSSRNSCTYSACQLMQLQRQTVVYQFLTLHYNSLKI